MVLIACSACIAIVILSVQQRGLLADLACCLVLLVDRLDRTSCNSSRCTNCSGPCLTHTNAQKTSLAFVSGVDGCVEQQGVNHAANMHTVPQRYVSTTLLFHLVSGQVTVVESAAAPATAATGKSWAWLNANYKKPKHYRGEKQLGRHPMIFGTSAAAFLLCKAVTGTLAAGVINLVSYI